MKKENIYVVIDTPKKVRKVREVLSMFNERIVQPDERALYSSNYTFDSGISLFDYGIMEFYEKAHITTRGRLSIGRINKKTKVSIKQLRNILAKEHLKSGDVIILEGYPRNNKIIIEVDEVRENDLGRGITIPSNNYLIDRDNKWHTPKGCGCVGNFVRYATKEEKALLNPEPKELEVGK